jgi:hypothetical protein
MKKVFAGAARADLLAQCAGAQTLDCAGLARLRIAPAAIADADSAHCA